MTERLALSLFGSFVRVPVGLFGMLVGMLAMLVCRGRVLLGVVVLTMFVMMGGLKMMMGGCVMMGRRLVMVLGRGMLLTFRHRSVLLQGELKGIETGGILRDQRFPKSLKRPSKSCAVGTYQPLGK